MSDELYQPISDVQLNQLKIEWAPHSSIRPNRYNPNKMTWHERMLLRQSLLEDGWTQPIVTLKDHTIVDGEQRWTTAGIETTPADIQSVIDHMERRKAQGVSVSESVLTRLYESKRRLEAGIAQGLKPCIATITGGLVPITVLDLGDDAHKMISTIRHNRARGVHQVDAMAAITQDLVKLGLDLEDLETRLGMDDEEIHRFLKAAEGQVAVLEADLREAEFSQAWAPKHVSEFSPEAQAEIQRSAAAAQALKQHEVELARRKAVLEERQRQEVARLEQEKGAPVPSIEKEEIARRVEQEIPLPSKPKPVELKKLTLFFTPEEYDLIGRVLGPDLAVGLVHLCQAEETRRAASVESPT